MTSPELTQCKGASKTSPPITEHACDLAFSTRGRWLNRWGSSGRRVTMHFNKSGGLTFTSEEKMSHPGSHRAPITSVGWKKSWAVATKWTHRHTQADIWHVSLNQRRWSLHRWGLLAAVTWPPGGIDHKRKSSNNTPSNLWPINVHT